MEQVTHIYLIIIGQCYLLLVFSDDTDMELESILLAVIGQTHFK